MCWWFKKKRLPRKLREKRKCWSVADDFATDNENSIIIEYIDFALNFNHHIIDNKLTYSTRLSSISLMPKQYVMMVHQSKANPLLLTGNKFSLLCTELNDNCQGFSSFSRCEQSIIHRECISSDAHVFSSNTQIIT